MKVLVTGAKGRLGQQLIARLPEPYQVVATDIDELDFTQAAHVADMMDTIQPDLVVHCGALTAVDACAEDPAEAVRVNGYGTKNLALACLRHQAALVYISTNEVFDGTNNDRYWEYDATHPINAYGHSKWLGEQFIRDHLQRFFIVRTSWLFAHGGRNFIQAILSRAESGQALRVVVNEVAAPTYTNDLAQGVVDLIATDTYGIYHLVNSGRASRWAFAREILDLAGYADTPIEKIAAAEFPRPSTPPEYSVLGNQAAAHLGITLRPWQDALRAFLAEENTLA